MPDRSRSNEPLLDLPEEDDTLSAEPLDSKVQKAQEQLQALKRQQELIEREKRELEELSRRQELLQSGKAEMLEKFTRAMVILERESFDAQRRVEQLQSIHAAFSQHLHAIDSINPKHWEGLDLGKELTKAISAIDDARAEYQKAMPRVSECTAAEPAGPGEDQSGFQLDLQGGDSGRDFLFWLKAGFAFTLPLLALGVIFLFLLLALQPGR